MVKVATTCLNLSHPIVHHHPSQSLPTSIQSPRTLKNRGVVVCLYVHKLNRSTLFGTQLGKLQRSRSCEIQKLGIKPLKRACSASSDAFSDEEFSREMRELASRFKLSNNDGGEEKMSTTSIDEELEIISEFLDNHGDNCGWNCSKFDKGVNFLVNCRKIPDFEEPPWVGISTSIERKANSVELPLSLRIIKKKKKKQWQKEGFGESAYSSVKKAFSSMVFMIRELQSYTLQMREALFLEDLQGVLVRVQSEMNASFVWLFQQVFSHTPTLMVYVMILLANFTVHSMGNNTAFAATLPPSSTVESVLVTENQILKPGKFDSSVIKLFSMSSFDEKIISTGGNNGDGGGGAKVGPTSSGRDGDGRNHESVMGQEAREGEEVKLWDSIVEEASSSLREKHLDHDTMQRFVSPVTAKIGDDDQDGYLKTELFYLRGLDREPENTLLLANYAQFLSLVAHNYDRAEEYFKKAVKIKPADAEAFNKYATFLWMVKKDLWAAEETYLEAISVDPDNAYYSANYANFLWSTGGEDTCYPLSSADEI